MNRKGQTLILFVIMIPIFLLVMAIVVDTGIILKEHTRLNSTTKTIIKTILESKTENNYEEQIIDLMNKNKIPTKNLKVEVKKNYIIIKNEYEKTSIFGNIIGIKNYKIKCSLKGTIEQEKIKIEKE